MQAERNLHGRGALLAAAALIVALLATLALAGTQPRAEAAAKARLTPTSQLLLRLTDLPPGYRVEEGLCRTYEVEDPPPVVARFIRQYQPAGCNFTYERLFGVPGGGPSPYSVTTAAIETPSVGVAEMGIAIAADLVSHLTGESGYAEVAPPAILGDSTRLFHPREDLEGDPEITSALIWRDGPVLAAIVVTAGSQAKADALAFALAARQQAHVEAPTPYTAAERDDSLVELDDPRLRVPVHWLGATFAPGYGLPPARALSAIGSSDRISGSDDPEYAIFYAHRLVLGAWTKTNWNRFVRDDGGLAGWTWRCTRSRPVALPQGRAVLYASYGRNFEQCPKRPPEKYSAQVFVGRTVIVVLQRPCKQTGRCSNRPYASFRGMAAAVRGLEVRPPQTRR